ncbi:unnamed protein product [Protopolystoma xenopodis]|uniref:Uncharacterized protein n=1 Tax=Protopolystoma xenopodis TaxID=117903 RepID=A0A3S5AB26_9PLAT|nr:unnamed protein product [Protopolystoma xenopodis]
MTGLELAWSVPSREASASHHNEVGSPFWIEEYQVVILSQEANRPASDAAWPGALVRARSRARTRARTVRAPSSPAARAGQKMEGGRSRPAAKQTAWHYFLTETSMQLSNLPVGSTLQIWVSQ